LQALWNDLSALDPSRAWKATRTFVEKPRQSVPFLQTVLWPHPPFDKRRLDRLLADLDSGEFPIREHARNELGKLGALAEPALRRTLDSKPSLEVRRQALALLDQIEKEAVSPEALRSSRVTAVLERIGTPESVARMALA
jgi:hypothetical protein